MHRYTCANICFNKYVNQTWVKVAAIIWWGELHSDMRGLHLFWSTSIKKMINDRPKKQMGCSSCVQTTALFSSPAWNDFFIQPSLKPFILERLKRYLAFWLVSEWFSPWIGAFDGSPKRYDCSGWFVYAMRLNYVIWVPRYILRAQRA